MVVEEAPELHTVSLVEVGGGADEGEVPARAGLVVVVLCRPVGSAEAASPRARTAEC
jgi:hypothetical protein